MVFFFFLVSCYQKIKQSSGVQASEERENWLIKIFLRSVSRIKSVILKTVNLQSNWYLLPFDYFGPLTLKAGCLVVVRRTIRSRACRLAWRSGRMNWCLCIPEHCSSPAIGHRKGHLFLWVAAYQWQMLGALQCTCKKWNRDLIKLDKGKCQVLHLRQTNPLHWSRLGSSWLGSSSAGKAWGDVGWQWAEHEPQVSSGSKERQQHPGVY